MRIIFTNLHSNVFYLKTLPAMVYGYSVATKHRYILDYLLSRDDIDVCSFINDQSFSFADNMSPSTVNKLKWFTRWEHKYVLKKNGISPERVKLITNSNDIRRDDIIISYIHFLPSFSQLDSLPGFKVISLLHLYGTEEESEQLKKVNPDVVFDEYDNYKHNVIFKKYFGWYKGDHILSTFVFANRFISSMPFAERVRKAFSPGTITTVPTDEYLKTYGTQCMQISRLKILDNAEQLKDIIDCYNSKFTEEYKPIILSKKWPSVFRKICAIYNNFHIGQQKKYFSFNIVEKYNEYAMFLCGEETTGHPGVGFVEGMACGSAFIGNSSIGCYEDLGMVSGVHYIGYDGTLEDLRRKIEYYQKEENQEELSLIASNGHSFALSFFNKNRGAEQLLNNILQSRMKSHEAK